MYSSFTSVARRPVDRKRKSKHCLLVPPKPRRRKAYHHGDLERALIDAALAAIAEHGVERLNLRDLARRVGVSPAAPYRHFADKGALVRAVAADIAARYAAELEQATAAAPPDALSQFRASGIAAVRFAVRHPAHFRVAYEHGIVGDNDDLAAARAGLAAAQAAGEIAPLPLDDILLTARCAIYGLSRMIVDGQLGDAPITVARADAMANAVTEVLGCGFVPRR